LKHDHNKFHATHRRSSVFHETQTQPSLRTTLLSQSPASCCAIDGALPLPGDVEPSKGWDARRRDSRVNGADIYVARTIKNGLGSAKPCWRCVHWCRWFGVKRIFHWNPSIAEFEVLKVNEGYKGYYETQADVRLFAGMDY